MDHPVQVEVRQYPEEATELLCLLVGIGREPDFPHLRQVQVGVRSLPKVDHIRVEREYRLFVQFFREPAEEPH